MTAISFTRIFLPTVCFNFLFTFSPRSMDTHVCVNITPKIFYTRKPKLIKTVVEKQRKTIIHLAERAGNVMQLWSTRRTMFKPM